MSANRSSYIPVSGFTGLAFGSVSFATEPGVARLLLSGELDLATAPSLRTALSNLDDAAVVILDLSEVTFMDSSGLHTIVAAHNRLRDANRRLVLVAGPAAVQRVFKLTGTDRVLEFAEAPDAGPTLRDKLTRRPK